MGPSHSGGAGRAWLARTEMWGPLVVGASAAGGPIMQRCPLPLSSQGKRSWAAESPSPPSTAPPPSAACRQPSTSWEVSERWASHWPGLRAGVGGGSRASARPREPSERYAPAFRVLAAGAEPLHASGRPGRNRVWGPVVALSCGSFCGGLKKKKNNFRGGVFRKPGSWGCCGPSKSRTND